MGAIIYQDLNEVLQTTHYRPAVSIIVPFEPKMSLKAELMHTLKISTDNVEKELQKNYPEEITELVIRKLGTLISNLNFNTHKKSIAIYVSPVFEKVLYLDLAVEEKIIIDESFEIRDLVYCKKQAHRYLLLVLSAKKSEMFLGNSESFVRIITNSPESLNPDEKDGPEKVANFSDQSAFKEKLMEKFLHHIDNKLDLILKSYQLPLFVFGTERILGHFKKVTRHNASVIEYISGNYVGATELQLKEALTPHIGDWTKIKQKKLLNELNEAINSKRLVYGMKDVWRQAMNHKGRLLLVEKNYMYAAEHSSEKENIYKAIEPYNKFSCIKDAVDDVIEKVLGNGGDVEFVEEGMLKDYHHIALIQYY